MESGFSAMTTNMSVSTNMTTNDTFQKIQHHFVSTYNFDRLAHQILCIVLFTIGCPANFIIIYLVSKVPRLKTPTNYFVSSLAVADFFVLIWVLFTVIEAEYRFLPLSKKMDIFFYPSVDMFLASASLVNVCCVSIDRAIACLRPLRYESIMACKVKSLLVITWSWSVIVLLLALTRVFAENNKFELFVFWLCVALSFFVPVFLVVVSYTTILVCAYKNIVASKTLYKSVQYSHREKNNNYNGDNTRTSKRSDRRNRRTYRELKVTCIILIIVMPYTVGWTFYVGSQLYELFFDNIVESSVFNNAISITPCLLSSINAYLYFMSNKAIRKSFFNLIARCRYKYEHQQQYNKRMVQSPLSLKRRNKKKNSLSIGKNVTETSV